MINVVIINGAPQSGKDQFVKYCTEANGKAFTENYSTVQFIKEFVIECGWGGEKTPKDRKFLADLKQLLTEWGDVPYRKAVDEIKSINYEATLFNLDPNQFILFIHCREPEEIAKFCINHNAASLLIRRSATVGNFACESDANTENFNYDYIIDNNGTLEELKEKAYNFVKEIKERGTHNDEL